MSILAFICVKRLAGNPLQTSFLFPQSRLADVRRRAYASASGKQINGAAIRRRARMYNVASRYFLINVVIGTRLEFTHRISE